MGRNPKAGPARRGLLCILVGGLPFDFSLLGHLVVVAPDPSPSLVGNAGSLHSDESLTSAT
jgi:hypothetical protein